MEIGDIVAAAIALRFFPFPSSMIAAVALGSCRWTWCAGLARILASGTWNCAGAIRLVVGLVMMWWPGAGSVARAPRRFRLLASSVRRADFVGSDQRPRTFRHGFGKAVYCLINIGLYRVRPVTWPAHLRDARRFGCAFYRGYLASDVFKDVFSFLIELSALRPGDHFPRHRLSAPPRYKSTPRSNGICRQRCAHCARIGPRRHEIAHSI